MEVEEVEEGEVVMEVEEEGAAIVDVAVAVGVLVEIDPLLILENADLGLLNSTRWIIRSTLWTS